MELLTEQDFVKLSNPGVTSLQLLSPHNSTSERLTITRVTVEPGVEQPPHRHATSEQIWLALEGSGELLLGAGNTAPFAQGQVARFADGEVHGLRNTGSQRFVYLSVTSPPINFDYAYRKTQGGLPK